MFYSSMLPVTNVFAAIACLCILAFASDAKASTFLQFGAGRTKPVPLDDKRSRKALTLDIRARDQHGLSEQAPHVHDVLETPSMAAAGMRSRVLAAEQQSPTQQLPEPGLDYLAKYFSRHSCTSPVESKQSCLFHNVCFIPGEGTNLTVVRLQGSTSVAAADVDQILLKQLQGLFSNAPPMYQTHVFAADHRQTGTIDHQACGSGSNSSSSSTGGAAPDCLAHRLWAGDYQFKLGGTDAENGAVVLTRMHMATEDHGGGDITQLLWEDKLTVVSKPGGFQNSFGHALGNTLLPLFLMLGNHFPAEDIPSHLQIMFATNHWQSTVLPSVAKATISHNIHLLPVWLSSRQKQGLAGVCFRNLLLSASGGGFPSVSIETLGGRQAAERATKQPTMFESKNWEAFKNHAYKVSDIIPAALTRTRPLILLNDKRYHKGSELLSDKRLILDIDKLASDISAAYPDADVLVVKLRDMPMVEQIQIMSAVQVFITTAGSSSHMAVFMPKGSSVIYLGAPETEQEKQTPWMSFTAFNELDRWFPLAYVEFLRYTTDINDTSSYLVRPIPGVWQPGDAEGRDRWWRYNADVRVDEERLRPMLNQALGL